MLSLCRSSETRAMYSPTTPPAGCLSPIDPIYFNMCDLGAVWGIMVEAFATAGILTSCVVLVVMISSLPFIKDRRRKNMLALQVGFQIFNLGLFGLSFAFVMGQNSIVCTVRKFVFGVLFAGCFACLLMHGLFLVLLDRKDKTPHGWPFWLGALGLWLVEVIINTEWMILAQMQQEGTAVLEACDTTNKDFTIALIYVMALLVAVVLMAVPSMTHKYKPFRQDALYIILTGVLSICVWLVWIVMYIHGNTVLHRPNWEDATMAIALVSNGWVFLMIYTMPEICALTQDTENRGIDLENQQGSSRSRVYENVVRDQTYGQQDAGRDNKAFSTQELDTGIIYKTAHKPFTADTRMCFLLNFILC